MSYRLHFGTPPPDSKLSELDAEIKRITEEKFQGQKDFDDQSIFQKVDVPEENLLMFNIRYQIEREIRKIWQNKLEDLSANPYYRIQPPVSIMVRDLIYSEIIDSDFGHILKEVLSVCNFAIHGGTVTEKQLNFINKNAAPIINYLKGLK